MLIRHLKTITLKKSVSTKQGNGSRTEEYKVIKDYEVQKQELDDQISASIYGANIINMCRIKSPLLDLENLLQTKLNNTDDNISKYFIFMNENKYKIKSVNSKGVVIELV